MSRRVAILELWDGLACEGGRRKERIDEWESASYSDNIDPTAATFSLAVPKDAQWLRNADLDLGDVVRITDHMGRVTERIISVMLAGDGMDDGLLHIEGQHPIMRMARCGPIRDVVQGGASWENLGGENCTPKHYWDTFIEPSLHRYGLTWIVAGVWEWLDRYSLAWQSWTPLQLLLELRNKAKRAEIDFRRVGDSHYEVDFLIRRGATAKRVTLHPRKNLRTIRRELRLDRITTVIQPQGVTVNGGSEPETIRYAAYEVTDIQHDTPITGRHTITIDYPGNGGTSKPILWDDQFGGSGLAELPNCWVLLPDASLVEVVDTIAEHQQLVVDGNISSLSVGDHIEIRRDADGGHLIELANPAAVARWGRIHRTLQVTEARGERNLLKNPTFKRSGQHFRIVGCRQASSLTSNSIPLKDLPPFYEVKAGDVLFQPQAAPIGTVITADATADASGNVTVQLGRAVQPSLNRQVYILHNDLPDGYVRPFTFDEAVVVGHRSLSASAPATVQLDGAQTVGASPVFPVPYVNIKGLAPGDQLQWGDVLQSNSPAVRLIVLDATPADEDGKATVLYWSTLDSTALGDGATLDVIRPPLVQDGGDTMACLTYLGSAALPPVLRSPTFRIRWDETLPIVRAYVAVQFWTPAASWTHTADNDNPLTVRLVDVTGGGATVLKTVTDQLPRSVPLQTVAAVLFSLPLELTSTRDLALDIIPPRAKQGVVTTHVANPFVFLRWGMVTLSPDPDTPFTPASHANTLVREGLAALEEESVAELVAGYEVEVRDLSACDEYVAADEAIVPGGEVRLYSPALGIDTIVRAVEVVHDLRHPENGRITLATDPRLLSRTLSRQRGVATARLVVQVDVAPSVQGGLAGGGTGAPVSITPDVKDVEIGGGTAPGSVPVNQPGRPRAVLPPGDTSIGGVVPVRPNNRGGGEVISPM